MLRSQTEIVTELKRRLDAYLADPENTTEADIQELIAELDRARNPEQAPRERASVGAETPAPARPAGDT